MSTKLTLALGLVCPRLPAGHRGLMRFKSAKIVNDSIVVEFEYLGPAPPEPPRKPLKRLKTKRSKAR